MTMADGCYDNLDSMLDLATKTEKDSWLLIDKLHLAPDSVFKVLKKRLQLAVKTKGMCLGIQVCIFGGFSELVS